MARIALVLVRITPRYLASPSYRNGSGWNASIGASTGSKPRARKAAAVASLSGAGRVTRIATRVRLPQTA